MELLSPASRQELSSLVRSPRRDSLYLVHSSSRGLAEPAARLLAAAWAGPSGDVRVASPEGRWTVEQVDAKVSAACSLSAPEGRVVVVEGLDAFSPGAADRLLMLAEHPPDGVSLVGTARDLSRVPRALVGRATSVAECAPASLESVVSTLVGQGADLATARNAADLLPLVSLVLAAAFDETTLQAASLCLNPQRWADTPYPDLVASVEVCASALKVAPPAGCYVVLEEACSRLRDEMRLHAAENVVDFALWDRIYRELSDLPRLERFSTPVPSACAWVAAAWEEYLDMSKPSLGTL